jgi:hypothetical protein
MSKKPNIARDGAPKRLQDVPTHAGMIHKPTPEGPFVSISRTQAAHPLDDEPNVIDPNPKFEKRLPRAAVAFGQRAEHHHPSILANRASHIEGQGQAILDSIASDGYDGHGDHVRRKTGGR